MVAKIMAFLSVCVLAGIANWYWVSVKSPTIASELAVGQLQSSNAAAEELRAYETGVKNVVPFLSAAGIVIAFLLLFGTTIKDSLCRVKSSLLILCVACLVFLSGCRVPFDAPEHEGIENNETGFLLPLEGNTGDQAKFASQAFLEEKKVAAKRVQITHRWIQTGRYEYEGKYLPTVKLIKVNRSPVTREWTDKPDTGTSRKDESIKVESKDSVNFSVGYTVTAMIKEPDAAKFLYWYSSGDLASVMDTEIRGRIQKITADECAKYDFDVVRAKKNEVAESVRKDVTDHYAERGVTITVIGMSGGFKYENPEIQKAIDETVQKQQLKVVAAAELEAQKDRNQKVLMEAEALAEKARRIAKGEADAKLLVAQAEAEAIKAVNKALNDGSQSTLLLQIKQLEIEKERIGKWNGQYPTYMMTLGSGTQAPGLLLQVPAAPK